MYLVTRVVYKEREERQRKRPAGHGNGFVSIAKRFYELNFYSLRRKIKIFQLLEFNQR